METVNNKSKPRLTHLDERKVLQVPFYKYEERVGICKQCFAYRHKDEMCDVNNSPTVVTCKQKSMYCPLGYWSAYYGS
jgi:hypothetical protein